MLTLASWTEVGLRLSCVDAGVGLAIGLANVTHFGVMEVQKEKKGGSKSNDSNFSWLQRGAMKRARTQHLCNCKDG